MKQGLIDFSIFILILSFIYACGSEKDRSENPDAPKATNDTAYIKTEVDNTDTDSLYEGY